MGKARAGRSASNTDRTRGSVLLQDQESTEEPDDGADEGAEVSTPETVELEADAEADADESPAGAVPVEPHRVSVIDRIMRDMLSRLGRADRGRVPQVVGSIGVGSGVGVTTVATSLAHVLSSDFDARVCYLDLTGTDSDRLANSFDDLINGVVSIETFFDDSTTGGVVGASLGAVTDAEWHALIRSTRFTHILEQLRKRFGYVVVDLPPMRPDGRTLAAAQHIDGFVLVTRHGKSTLSDVETALADLGDVAEVGVIVNRYRPRTPRFVRRWLRVR